MPRPPRHTIARVATLALVACVAALAVPGSAKAHPPAPFGPGGGPLNGPVHAWLHQANVPLVEGRVHVLVGGCPGAPLFVGCIYTRRPRVIYLSPAAQRPRAVLYHELGHTFDLRVLQPRHRRVFKRMVGIRTRGWFSSSPPASEWFADAYALCAVRRRLRAPRPATPYGYRATPSRHARACALIREAAAPDGPRKRRPKPRPPGDTPRVVEPHEAPPPSPPGQKRPPTGPYQPPLDEAPTYLLPGCDLVEQILTGCSPP